MHHGPYARISLLRPHDGDTVNFEAGYIRHFDWDRQTKDPWTWVRWTIGAGERQCWLVYATFGHSAADLDNPVSPRARRASLMIERSRPFPKVRPAGTGTVTRLPSPWIRTMWLSV